MTRRILALAAALLLAACGDDGSAPGATNNLSGTVATGAPVSGATLTASCSNGQTYLATTSSTGRYGLRVPASAFPCALRASGGNLPAGITALHSYAAGTGTINVTPLTDLALALQVQAATGQTLATWFSAPGSWTTISAALLTSVDDLRDALIAAGYTLPTAWTAGSSYPLTVVFTPDPAVSALDRLLEAVAAAIADPGSGFASYDALLAAFTTSPTLPTAADPGLSGDGAALGDSDGVTGTLANTAYTFTGNVQWAVLGGSGNFAAFLPSGGGIDALTRWDINGLPASTGTYACKSDAAGLLPRIQLTSAGTIYSTSPAGGSCVIKITTVTANYITGQFSATLVGANGSVVGTVSDGFFRKAAATGGGGGLGAGEVGASFTVDGTDYRYTNANDLSFETFKGMAATPAEAASPGFPVGIQLHTLPAAAGTYSCDTPADGNNLYRKINVWFYWNGKTYSAGNRQWNTPGPSGSSCSITLTAAGSTQEGSFSGTFVASDASSVTVSNGAFRYIAPAAPPPQLPASVSALLGVWNGKVTTANSTLGMLYNTDASLVIDASGNLTAAGYSFNFGDYTAAGSGSGRQSNYTYTKANGDKLTVYNNENAVVAFEVKIGANSAVVSVRPVAQGMVDFFADLIAGGTVTLKNKNAAFYPTDCSQSHAITFTGTASTTAPALEYWSPGATEFYSAIYSRYKLLGNGDRQMANYYGRLVLTAGGNLYWYAYDGSGYEYGEYWTNDPAACP